jgi:cellulose 1,4-beta-cellobiosidase
LKTLLDGAKAKQAKGSKKQTVFFIHYDLPNRDCAASASNGEICCSGNKPDASTGACDDQSYRGGSCEGGLTKYRQYTDAIVSLLKNYPEIEIVALVEPDSLPNLATNLNVKPHCTDTTAAAYVAGVSYAIKQLGTVSNV